MDQVRQPGCETASRNVTQLTEYRVGQRTSCRYGGKSLTPMGKEFLVPCAAYDMPAARVCQTERVLRPYSPVLVSSMRYRALSVRR